MSTIAYTMDQSGGGLLVVWSSLGTGDSGSKLAMAGHSDKTVSVIGTATTFALLGSNDITGTNTFTLTDIFTGDPITATGMYVIKENPLLIWPLVTTGSGVTVKIVAP
jgi:hypothetical protein